MKAPRKDRLFALLLLCAVPLAGCGGNQDTVHPVSPQERAITTLWGGGSANGVAWARHLELVVVPRIDQGSPLRIAHRFWALRRLCLAFPGALPVPNGRAARRRTCLATSKEAILW